MAVFLVPFFVGLLLDGSGLPRSKSVDLNLKQGVWAGLAILVIATFLQWGPRIAYEFCKYLNFKFIERIDFYLEFYRYFQRAEDRKYQKLRQLTNQKLKDSIRRLHQSFVLVIYDLLFIFIYFLIFMVFVVIFCLSAIFYRLKTIDEIHGVLCDAFGATFGTILSNKIEQIFVTFIRP